MEITFKTNRLATISFLSGLIAFLILGALLLVGGTTSPGKLPEPASPIDFMMVMARSVLDLCTLLSLLMGILALRDMAKKSGMEKGKLFAWTGIVLGVGPRLLVAAYLILGQLFSLR
jgi:hypothetical protein